MTQSEKAEMYEAIVREGDIIQREMSKLKSNNIGGNNEKENARLADLNQKMAVLEGKMNNLMQGQ